MTGVDPKGLSQATFEDKIEAIAHRWAIASYNKALGRTFEDIDAIKVELRRAITPLKGAPVAWLRPRDIARLSEMSPGAINAKVANTSFEFWTVPVFASQPLPETEEKR